MAVAGTRIARFHLAWKHFIPYTTAFCTRAYLLYTCKYYIYLRVKGTETGYQYLQRRHYNNLFIYLLSVWALSRWNVVYPTLERPDPFPFSLEGIYSKLKTYTCCVSKKSLPLPELFCSLHDLALDNQPGAIFYNMQTWAKLINVNKILYM